MMATYNIVALNDGNKEYLRDGKNCLLYEFGDIKGAIKSIKRLVSDFNLQNKLYIIWLQKK